MATHAASSDAPRLALAARDKRRPWGLGKDVEHSSVASEIVPILGVAVEKGELMLSVNGKVRQQSDLSKLFWKISELIAHLSKFYHQRPGDLILKGTPEGVGAVPPGDRIQGLIGASVKSAWSSGRPTEAVGMNGTST
jgi:fumarylpyruvate hydrolase